MFDFYPMKWGARNLKICIHDFFDVSDSSSSSKPPNRINKLLDFNDLNLVLGHFLSKRNKTEIAMWCLSNWCVCPERLADWYWLPTMPDVSFAIRFGACLCQCWRVFFSRLFELQCSASPIWMPLTPWTSCWRRAVSRAPCWRESLTPCFSGYEFWKWWTAVFFPIEGYGVWVRAGWVLSV